MESLTKICPQRSIQSKAFWFAAFLYILIFGLEPSFLWAVPPSTPTGLRVAPAGTAARAQWNLNTDNAAYYRLYRASVNATSPYVIATTLNHPAALYTDPLVTSNRSYWYKISALNAQREESALSEPVRVNMPPRPPSQMRLRSGNARIQIDWTHSPDIIDHYNLYRASASAGVYSVIATLPPSQNIFLDLTVTNSRVYFYKVSAMNSLGIESSLAGGHSATPHSPPNSITFLTATPGNGQVWVRWSENQDIIDAYRIYRSTVQGGNFGRIGQISHPTAEFLDSTPLNDTTYWYKITAVDSLDIESPLNAALTVSALPSENQTGPNPPPGLRALPRNGSVELNWLPLATGSHIIRSYRLYRSRSELGPYSRVQSVTHPNGSVLDTNLVNGQPYWYKISAIYDTNQETLLSNAVPATPNVGPLPPLELTAFPENQRVTLNWNRSRTLNIGHYRVERSTFLTFGFTPIGTAEPAFNTFIDQNLTNGTTYWYRVITIGVNGAESTPTTITAKPDPSPFRPPTPTNLGVSARTGGALVTWTHVNASVRSYLIYRSENPAGPFLRAGSAGRTLNSFLDSNLVNGRSYWYRIGTSNPINYEGLLSLPAVQTVPLTPPVNVRAVPGNGRATLTWEPAVGGNIYHIYYATRPITNIGNATPVRNVTSPAIISNLTNGITYYFQMTTTNNFGESNPTLNMSAIPSGTPPPPPPTGVQATGGNNQITITWLSVSGATSYNVYYLTRPGVTRVSGTARRNVSSPYIITSLANNLTYYAVVTAVNSFGESPESAEVFARPSGPGSPPQNQAPRVYAGPVQTIFLPSRANLRGEATDDGLPRGTLTTTWTKTDGPGTVTFGDPNAPLTTAQFSLPGHYILRLTASDSELSHFSETAINVIEAIAGEKDNFSQTKLFPNPLVPSKGIHEGRLLQLPSNTKRARVLTLTGEVVRELSVSDPANVVWDAKNDSGETVVSNTYLILIETDQTHSTLKAVVAR